MAVVVLVVLALFLLCLYSILHLKWILRRMPPGPVPLPFIGNVLLMLGNANTAVYRLRRFGEISTITIGHTPIVILHSARAIHEAYVVQSEVFAGRPHTGSAKQFYDRAAIVFNDGNEWRENRRAVMRLLRDHGMGKRSLEPLILDECGIVREKVAANEAMDGSPVMLCPLFAELTGNVIGRILFSERVYTDDPNFRVIEVNTRRVADASPLVFLPFMPLATKLGAFQALLNRLCNYKVAWSDQMDAYVRAKLESHAARFDPDAEPTDMCDGLLLNEHRRLTEEGGPSLASEASVRLTPILGELLSASVETTASTLVWCLLLLAGHPRIQRRVRAEIGSKLGPERVPSMADRADLPLVCAVVDETLRYFMVSATGLAHRPIKDTEVLGYAVPAGTTVLSNIRAVHRDPALWERPEEFFPEHFLGPDGEYRPSRHLIPFSVGARRCVGENLAKMEAFLCLVTLMQAFEVAPAPGDKPVSLAESGLVARPGGRARVVFVEAPAAASVLEGTQRNAS